MENFLFINTDRMDRELRYRYAHGPSYRSLLSCAPTPLPGSAHAPPINSVGADCDSQPEQEIKKIPAQVCESRGSTATVGNIIQNFFRLFLQDLL